ncbi:MAG TPA: caleosin family protein, partial [Polyangiaceae bacterium]|nr:caleosin family protein [Polyangiaceae bacterium]
GGGRARAGASALERHAAFFDRDGDGFVDPAETFAALRDLGVGPALGGALTCLIHGALGPLTRRRPALRIRVDAIARGKRKKSSGVFGPDGAFSGRAFDRLREGAGGEAGALTLRELRRLIDANPDSRSNSPLEAFFSRAETRVLFCLAADASRPEGGRDVPALTLKRLRSFYAGDLLYALARRRRLARRAAAPPVP